MYVPTRGQVKRKWIKKEGGLLVSQTSMTTDVDRTSRKAKIENELRESQVCIDDGEGSRRATAAWREVGVSGEEEGRKV